MKLSPSAASIRASAQDFMGICSGQLVAWEEGAATRTLALVERVCSGHLDASSMRAAFGDRGNTPTVSAPKGTAVVSLTGVLTPGASLFTMLGIGTSLLEFSRQLRAADGDPLIAAIVIVVDSPGGLVSLVPETAALMRRVRARKPVVAVVSGYDASAAYWITSNATRLEATPSANIGAIGVYTTRVSVARQLERDGIDVEVFSAGRHKAEGQPVTPITDPERQATMARVNETYGEFIADVGSGRGVSVSAVSGGFGEGRVVSAKQALRLGMIDQIALVEDTVARIAGNPRGARAWSVDSAREARLRARFDVFAQSPGPSPAADDERGRRMRFL